MEGEHAAYPQRCKKCVNSIRTIGFCFLTKLFSILFGCRFQEPSLLITSIIDCKLQCITVKGLHCKALFMLRKKPTFPPDGLFHRLTALNGLETSRSSPHAIFLRLSFSACIHATETQSDQVPDRRYWADFISSSLLSKDLNSINFHQGFLN